MGMMLGASVAPVLAPEVYGLVLSIIITNPQVVQKATEFVAGTVPGPPPPTPMGYAGAGTAWVIQELSSISQSSHGK